jgi:hypothetical protein
MDAHSVQCTLIKEWMRCLVLVIEVNRLVHAICLEDMWSASPSHSITRQIPHYWQSNNYDCLAACIYTRVTETHAYDQIPEFHPHEAIPHWYSSSG